MRPSAAAAAPQQSARYRRALAATPASHQGVAGSAQLLRQLQRQSWRRGSPKWRLIPRRGQEVQPAWRLSHGCPPLQSHHITHLSTRGPHHSGMRACSSRPGPLAAAAARSGAGSATSIPAVAHAACRNGCGSSAAPAHLPAAAAALLRLPLATHPTHQPWPPGLRPVRRRLLRPAAVRTACSVTALSAAAPHHPRPVSAVIRTLPDIPIGAAAGGQPALAAAPLWQQQPHQCACLISRSGALRDMVGRGPVERPRQAWRLHQQQQWLRREQKHQGRQASAWGSCCKARLHVGSVGGRLLLQPCSSLLAMRRASG